VIDLADGSQKKAFRPGKWAIYEGTGGISAVQYTIAFSLRVIVFMLRDVAFVLRAITVVEKSIEEVESKKEFRKGSVAFFEKYIEFLRNSI